jgi:hypothetical protein
MTTYNEKQIRSIVSRAIRLDSADLANIDDAQMLDVLRELGVSDAAASTALEEHRSRQGTRQGTTVSAAVTTPGVFFGGALFGALDAGLAVLLGMSMPFGGPAGSILMMMGAGALAVSDEPAGHARFHRRNAALWLGYAAVQAGYILLNGTPAFAPPRIIIISLAIRAVLTGIVGSAIVAIRRSAATKNDADAGSAMDHGEPLKRRVAERLKQFIDRVLQRSRMRTPDFAR